MSKLLDELNQLRKNLDKNTKKTPDYHITTKVVVDDKRKMSIPKSNNSQKSDTDIIYSTNKVKNEIRELFQFGFNLSERTKLAMSTNTYEKYETFRFRDKFHLSDILTEYSKYANMLVFLIDTNRNSIFWNNYDVSEVRVIIK